jgi:hypothetical protein
MAGFPKQDGTGRARWSLLRGLPLLSLWLAASAPAMDLDPMLIGKWPRFGGGPVLALAAGERHAYCAVGGSGLWIIDLAEPLEDPLHPQPVGFYEAPDIEDVAVSGHRAWVKFRKRFELVDAGDPAAPRLLGSHDVAFPHRAFAVRGDMLHFPEWVPDLGRQVLRLIDAADPENPREAGRYEGADLVNVQDVFVSGRYAYVAQMTPEGGDLVVLDVGDPARPRRVGGLQGSFPRLENLLVAGGYAYATPGAVIDVTDPASPRRAGVFGPVEPDAPLALAGSFLLAGKSVYDASDPRDLRPAALLGTEVVRDLFVRDGRAYTAGDAGLQVFDVSSPRDRSRLGYHDARGEGDLRAFTLDGSRAYLARIGLEVVDVSDPANPRQAGRLAQFPEVDGFGFAVHDLFASGGRAYAAGYGGLRVLDVSDPEAPRQVGALLTTARLGQPPEETQVPAIAVTVSGSHAYLATSFGLVVADVSDPSRPRLVADAQRNEGTRFDALFVAEGRAYLAGRHLEVYDVSEPAAPRRLGSYGEGRGAGSGRRGLFVAGGHAYFLGDGLLVGLLVIDVRDPAAPRLAGRYAGDGRGFDDVFVLGDRAFLADRSGLEVLDVSDPARPELVERYGTFLPARRIALAGGLVYAASWEPPAVGLEIFDLAIAPAPPRLAGRYDTTLTVSDVLASGSLLYVTDNHASLHVFEASDAAAPRRVGRYENRRRAERRGGIELVNRVFVSGETAYVFDQTTYSTTVLETIDIGDPSSPELVGRFDAGLFAGDSFLSDGHAYLAYTDYDARGLFEARLEVLDCRDPAFIRPAGAYATSGHARGVFVSGAHAYLSVDDGYDLLDVRDPRAPRLLRRFDNRPGNVVAAAGFAYVGYAGPEGSGFEILDAADPLNPRALGRYLHGEFSAPRIQVSGDRAYLSWINQPPAGPGGRFQVIDVSDPARPRLIGRYPYSELKHAAGSLAYVQGLGTPRRGLEVIDLGRPANPQRVGFHDAGPGVLGRFFLSGGLAYVAGGQSGLHILDVRDPRSPRRIGGHETSDAVRDVVVSGVHAYAADGFAGLQVLDVSEPADPRRAGGHVTGGSVRAVSISGGLAYIGQWDSAASGSLHVIDVTEPAAPRRLGGIGTLRAAHRVLISGRHAYAATILGLEIIDVADPAAPRLEAAYSTGIIDMALAGSRAYLMTGVGLVVLDASDPGALELIGTHAMWGSSIDIVGEYAYVTSAAGVEVLEVRDPARPRRIAGNSAVFPAPALAARGERVFVAQGSAFAVLELQAPFPPADLAAEAADGEVRLAWNAPSGGLAPAGYDVYRLSPGPRARVNAEPVAGAAFTATGLANGLEHCFAVRSLSAAGGASDDSLPACATPRATAARFLRGDCDGDGRVAGMVTDAVFLLEYSFRGGPRPPCLAACDADGDGRAAGQVTDAVYLLNYNFLGGPPPAAPFPECGPGLLPGDERLGCATAPARCE